MQNRRFRKSLAQVAPGKFGIAGHERDADLRPDGFQLRREFPSAHLGHDHVAQEEVNRARIAAGDVQCLVAAFGFEHVITFDAQELAGQFAHARFVLDDENRLAPARNRRGFFLRLGARRFSRGLRKINLKRRARARVNCPPK